MSTRMSSNPSIARDRGDVRTRVVTSTETASSQAGCEGVPGTDPASFLRTPWVRVRHNFRSVLSEAFRPHG
jgi:hypothetical protein